MKYAIIDQENKVVNIIEWDGESEYCPCADHTMIKAGSDTMLGAVFENSVFINPPQPAIVPTPSANETLMSEIATLEASVTERRVREAVLGIDNGWLKNMDDKIAALRTKLI